MSATSLVSPNRRFGKKRRAILFSAAAQPTNTTYQYVSTNGGISGAGQIGGVRGIDGSQYMTSTFSAAANAPLQFYFNYITSDGAIDADYAFAQLKTSAEALVATLFTARTTV